MILAPRKIICGIYKITTPSGKVYIGQSRHILIRWRDHKRDKTAKSRVFYSLIKYGAEAHIFEIIHELPKDIDQDVLTIYEQLYMDMYASCKVILLNLRQAGSKGKLSQEAKIKLSNSLKGKVPWNKGIKTNLIPWNKGVTGVVKFSDEVRQRISDANKGHKNNLGRKMDDKTKLAIAKANIGREMSPEQKDKISKARTEGPNRGGVKNKGKIRTAENRNKISESLRNRTDNKGSMHNMAILNEAQVLEIRIKYIPKKYSAQKLANEYSVCKSTILGIINNETWRHI
jgi:group I intron endonuclease